MRAFITLLALSLTLATSARAADSDAEIITKIDELIRLGWEDNEVKPSPRATDEEFARRVTLDILGRIPDYQSLLAFLDDESRSKRELLVNDLLDNEAYIRNWTGIWGNLLVGQANNRGGGRAALDRWLRQAFYSNMPYDQFVRELISAQGNSQENGAVVFLASHLNDGAIPATSITSKLFLGRQVQCTQCHDHPFNDWKQSQFWGMNAFFKGTRRQGNAMNGVSLSDDPAPEMIDFERRSGLMVTTMRTFFDGSRGDEKEFKVTIDPFKNIKQADPDTTPRQLLASFMLDPKKPYIAETQVNRLWAHFFGFGFTKPVDDMGPHNSASHPELVAYLAKQFQESGYDNKRLIRWITSSEAYNLTSQSIEGNEYDDPVAGNTPLFTKMYLKQFRAEQLYDSLLIATAANEVNRNAEQAEAQRATWLRQFVQTFGTDENDESSSFNGTIPQALLLMNGQLMNNALSGGRGSLISKVLASADGKLTDGETPPLKSARARQLAALRAAKAQGQNIPAKIETLFLVALARKPSDAEMNAFNEVYRNSNYSDQTQGLQDVFWAVLNSNEFIINH
ncbi:MAG: DUF1549 domain-containing protein [Planctomycetota bacterium]|nr:DUF1549 domain-containing protein [Planctomycetota bacterium]MDA1249086.1 DUF1549 domain-containing protein [Planctomycetota bacterium]